MRIIKIKGGLGNQMFQYAFAKKIAEVTGDIVKLDFSLFHSIMADRIRQPRLLKFDIKLPLAEDKDITALCHIKHNGNGLSKIYKAGLLLETVINKEYFLETNRRYIPVKSIKNYKYFDGYWQSWRYVDEIFESVAGDFIPLKPMSSKTQLLINKVKKENSVFIGIRKGDYTAEASHYGSFGQKYYESAMVYIDNKVKNPIYYIFSNDIEWVKRNIHFGKRKIIFRNSNDVIDDFEEFILMSSCTHAIISNSTFYWWGARLSDGGEKIVVAPQKWFFDDKPIDIIPPHWIRI